MKTTRTGRHQRSSRRSCWDGNMVRAFAAAAWQQVNQPGVRVRVVCRPSATQWVSCQGGDVRRRIHMDGGGSHTFFQVLRRLSSGWAKQSTAQPCTEGEMKRCIWVGLNCKREDVVVNIIVVIQCTAQQRHGTTRHTPNCVTTHAAPAAQPPASALNPKHTQQRLSLSSEL